jgi:hypothetical protein
METKTGRPNDYEMSELAPNFGGTFATISTLMTIQEAKLKNKSTATGKTEELESSNPGNKRPRPVSLTSIPPKRPKGEREAESPKQPTTPDQPTTPVNPKFSSATEESQAEPATDKLLYIFLGETMRALKMEFGAIRWTHSGKMISINQTYLHPFHQQF